MKTGKFIVFEGIDGAGKSTQIAKLAKALSEKGREVLLTAEPTDGVTGKMLRAALSGKEERTPYEMAALFVLDRIYHNKEIAAALAAGKDVICDRYYYSSLAYQGSLCDYEWVKQMNVGCPAIRRPDLCIFLDLTPEQSMERIGKGRVTLEVYENVERLTRVRKQFFDVFDSLGKDERICIVNAARSVEGIHQEIVSIVEKLF